jgi:hypothetical protein
VHTDYWNLLAFYTSKPEVCYTPGHAWHVKKPPTYAWLVPCMKPCAEESNRAATSLIFAGQSSLARGSTIIACDLRHGRVCLRNSACVGSGS